ncbi:hypothetical protein A2130_00620 [Candidatus Woesebacteria bacterium GWC2_33_12]|nr:MAG: hypothetical protein A2130_00620 [Candidatus Woesebacteria bacterium GWC2_33_12]OGM78734.1 MAG: hypothetical protein A2366_03965 [Candidatus Woesebacteria bacterium RIFOXYB1_FULL_33_9]
MGTENLYRPFFTGINKFEMELIPLPNRVGLPNYVAIEGNSGAGKTSTSLLVHKETQLPHIGEYGNYIDFEKNESFPQFPPNNVQDIIQSNTLWSKIEFRRRVHQLNLQDKFPNSLQIVERSSISLFAFEYAKMKLGLPYEFTHLSGLYSMLYETTILKEPCGYVFLRVSPETVRARINIENANKSLKFLCNRKSVLAINEFISFFLNTYIDNESFIILDSVKFNQVGLSKQIIEFIDKLKSRNRQSNGISRFNHDVLAGKIIF